MTIQDLCDMRRDLGLTQKFVASKLGVPLEYINSFEWGMNPYHNDTEKLRILFLEYYNFLKKYQDARDKKLLKISSINTSTAKKSRPKKEGTMRSFSKNTPYQRKNIRLNGVLKTYKERVNFATARDFEHLELYFLMGLGIKEPHLISGALSLLMQEYRNFRFFRAFRIERLLGRKPKYSLMKEAVQRMKESSGQ